MHARRGDERRLQPAVQPRTVRRTEHARRPAFRESGRRARSSSASPRITGDEILIAATREARAHADARSDEVNFLSGPGRGVILIKLSSDDGSRARLRRVDRRSRPHHRRNQPRRRADDQHGEIRGDRARRQGTRAAAARAVHEVVVSVPDAPSRYLNETELEMIGQTLFALSSCSPARSFRRQQQNGHGSGGRTARGRQRDRPAGGIRSGAQCRLETRAAAGIFLADRLRRSHLPDRHPRRTAHELGYRSHRRHDRLGARGAARLGGEARSAQPSGVAVRGNRR